MDTRSGKTVNDESGAERYVECFEARIYSDAFDTGWIDVSGNPRAAEDAWERENPPAPQPVATGVVLRT